MGPAKSLHIYYASVFLGASKHPKSIPEISVELIIKFNMTECLRLPVKRLNQLGVFNVPHLITNERERKPACAAHWV